MLENSLPMAQHKADIPNKITVVSVPPCTYLLGKNKEHIPKIPNNM